MVRFAAEMRPMKYAALTLLAISLLLPSGSARERGSSSRSGSSRSASSRHTAKPAKPPKSPKAKPAKPPKPGKIPKIKPAKRRNPPAAYCATCPRDGEGRIKRSRTAIREFQKMHPCPSTGRTSGACPGYVIDHIVALKRGGADSPRNMQWQTVAEAKAKDKIE